MGFINFTYTWRPTTENEVQKTTKAKMFLHCLSKESQILVTKQGRWIHTRQWNASVWKDLVNLVLFVGPSDSDMNKIVFNK